MRHIIFLVVFAAVVTLLDQATKRIAEEKLVRGSVVHVMPGFDLRLTRNPGAAWGFLADVRETYRKPFFIAISLATMAFLVALYAAGGGASLRQRVALPLVLGGALGNFIDRMLHGAVTDFIDWHAQIGGKLRHWPTFNVADAAITVGVLLLAWDLFTQKEVGEAASSNSSPEAEHPQSARGGDNADAAEKRKEALPSANAASSHTQGEP